MLTEVLIKDWKYLLSFLVQKRTEVQDLSELLIELFVVSISFSVDANSVIEFLVVLAMIALRLEDVVEVLV